MILDSGNRREFESGAVRDIQEGKGRCDLLPLSEVAFFMDDDIIGGIAEFVKYRDLKSLKIAIAQFIKVYYNDNYSNAMLDLSKHYEEGAVKYGERNWEKGIPAHCFLDSGIRHYLKLKRGDTDERHDRAFLWNIMGLLWTISNKPDLDDLFRGDCVVDKENI